MKQAKKPSKAQPSMELLIYQGQLPMPRNRKEKRAMKSEHRRGKL